jgi:hypothetical protein
VTGSSLLVLLVLVVGGLWLLLYLRRSAQVARERATANLTEVRPAFEEDVTRLGEELEAFDLDVDAPSTSDQMRGLYTRALDAYDAAKASLERAVTTMDLQPVTAALEDGRYNLSAVLALQAGQPVPQRRAPCFFNPQHGPSVKDVKWAPSGGSRRDVPVCADCADRLARGDQVDVKTVSVGRTRMPYWDAGPEYAPYAGGYYGGFGSMLPGMLVGTILGSSMGMGGGYGDWGDGYGYGGNGTDGTDGTDGNGTDGNGTDGNDDGNGDGGGNSDGGGDGGG